MIEFKRRLVDSSRTKLLVEIHTVVSSREKRYIPLFRLAPPLFFLIQEASKSRDVLAFEHTVRPVLARIVVLHSNGMSGTQGDQKSVIRVEK